MRDGFFMYYSLVYTEVHRELLCRRNKYDIIYIYIFIFMVFLCAIHWCIHKSAGDARRELFCRGGFAASALVIK